MADVTYCFNGSRDDLVATINSAYQGMPIKGKLIDHAGDCFLVLPEAQQNVGVSAIVTPDDSYMFPSSSNIRDIIIEKTGGLNSNSCRLNGCYLFLSHLNERDPSPFGGLAMKITEASLSLGEVSVKLKQLKRTPRRLISEREVACDYLDISL